MTLYRYETPSLIDEVRVVKNATGGLRAYLHARSDATPQELATVKESLLEQAWKCTPYTEDGRALLEVRGFKASEEFVQHLNRLGFTSGKATITTLKTDKVSTSEKLRNATLRGTGFIYNIGDILYLTYAIKGFRHEKARLARTLELRTAEQIAAEAAIVRKPIGTTKEALLADAKDAYHGGKLDVGGGIGYALGGSVLSLFASQDQSQYQIRDQVKKVRQYLNKEGISAPQESSVSNLTQKEHKTTLQRVHQFIVKHPSEILNTVYAGVGILLAAASIKKVKSGWVKGEAFFSDAHKEVRNDVKDIGLGAITMSSALTGLLVKEKKREPGQPKRKGFGGVVDWIQEKPLRATGVGYFISTIFHAWATYGKYRDGDPFVRETVRYRAGFVAANILAEALLFVSSKGHGQGIKSDDSVEKCVIAATAEIIARQNPAQQDQLIERVAGYMASPEVLGGKAETIAAELRAQVAGIKTNPWAQLQHEKIASPAPVLVTPPAQPLVSPLPQIHGPAAIAHQKLTPAEHKQPLPSAQLAGV